MTKAVVLLSGGQDSTTVLHYAIRDMGGDPHKVVALSVHYGQRHAAEIAAAGDIAAEAGVAHHFVDLTSVFKGSSSALIDRAMDIAATGGVVDREAPEGLPTSFVPGRNLLFFAAAASFAGAHGADRIYTGVCQTDYSGYPDCRAEFVQAMNFAIRLAWPTMALQPIVIAPLMHMTKADTVTLACELGDRAYQALRLSITCYHGQRPGCGECPACVLRAKGFAEAGMPDPAALYQSVALETP